MQPRYCAQTLGRVLADALETDTAIASDSVTPLDTPYYSSGNPYLQGDIIRHRPSCDCVPIVTFFA
jgi:hypothetical protein